MHASFGSEPMLVPGLLPRPKAGGRTLVGRRVGRQVGPVPGWIPRAVSRVAEAGRRARGGDRVGMHVCAEPGCPRLQTQTRCLEHRRQRERARGTTTERGYGSAHAKLRATYQADMDRGKRYDCWRCGAPIDPTSWQLGHDDLDRRIYRGPECPPCNLATAGRNISRGG